MVNGSETEAEKSVEKDELVVEKAVEAVKVAEVEEMVLEED